MCRNAVVCSFFTRSPNDLFIADILFLRPPTGTLAAVPGGPHFPPVASTSEASFPFYDHPTDLRVFPPQPMFLSNFFYDHMYHFYEVVPRSWFCESCCCDRCDVVRAGCPFCYPTFSPQHFTHRYIIKGFPLSCHSHPLSLPATLWYSSVPRMPKIWRPLMSRWGRLPYKQGGSLILMRNFS